MLPCLCCLEPGIRTNHAMTAVMTGGMTETGVTGTEGIAAAAQGGTGTGGMVVVAEAPGRRQMRSVVLGLHRGMLRRKALRMDCLLMPHLCGFLLSNAPCFTSWVEGNRCCWAVKAKEISNLPVASVLLLCRVRAGRCRSQEPSVLNQLETIPPTSGQEYMFLPHTG